MQPGAFYAIPQSPQQVNHRGSFRPHEHCLTWKASRPRGFSSRKQTEIFSALSQSPQLGSGLAMPAGKRAAGEKYTAWL